MSEQPLGERQRNLLIQGYRAVSVTVDSILGRRPRWRCLSIVTYDERCIEGENWIITPEFFLISMAEHVPRRKMKTVLLLDASREHQYSVASIPEFYQDLFRMLGMRDVVFFFGSDVTGVAERTSIPFLQLPLRAVLDYEFLSSLLKYAIPIPRTVEKRDVEGIGDIVSLSNFLIDVFRPPTLIEELKKEFASVTPERIGGHILSSLTVIFNPSVAFSKGLGYAFQFLKILTKEKPEEYKRYIKEWENNIKRLFSPDALSRLISEDGNLGEVMECLRRKNLAVILCENFKNVQSLFIPILIREIMSENPNVLFIVDSITRLDRYRDFLDLLKSMIEADGLRLMSMIPTFGEFSSWFLELFDLLVSEYALFFNADSRFIRRVFEGRSITEEAWVVRQFRQVRQLLDNGEVAFILFDACSEKRWQFVKPKLLVKIKHKIKWFFR
ncbi:MAG: hypothetical protein ACTSXJ_10095 [Candidatus Baldrarchaeia archaeon]